MPIDQFKLSMEAWPLQSLYCKYSIGDGLTTPSAVRPLGRLRTDTPLPKSLDAVQFREIRNVQPNLVRFNTDTDLIMNRSVENEKIRNLRKSEQIFNDLGTRERESGFSGVTRIRRQEFENKFRIAASRANGQESPPLKPSKDFSKKVIHLPCFQINLRTYEGEQEVTRAVARTRESLRQMIDIQKSKAKANNVVTANIMNYEFLAPTKSNSAKSSSDSSNGPIQPFPAKPIIKTQVRCRESDAAKNGITFGRVAKFGGHIEDNDIKSVLSDKDFSDMTSARRKFDHYLYQNDSHDVHTSVPPIALQPMTSLTLGSTMHHIDGVLVNSSYSEEIREISDALKYPEFTSPDYTGCSEMYKIQNTPNGPFSRPRNGLSTDRGDFGKSVDRQYFNRVKFPDHQCSTSSSSMDNNRRSKPVLRYTSKTDTYKLEPIVVPSHTCTECPMCNIFHRDMIESPCPPNSPMSSQFMDCVEQPVIEPEFGPATEDRTPRKPQILHMSRITVAGNVTPSEEHTQPSVMKAKC